MDLINIKSVLREHFSTGINVLTTKKTNNLFISTNASFQPNNSHLV